MPAFDPFGSLRGAPSAPNRPPPLSDSEALALRDHKIRCLLAFDSALTACGAADPSAWSLLSETQASLQGMAELVFSHPCGLFALIENSPQDPRGPRITARSSSLDTLRPPPPLPPTQLSVFWPAAPSDPRAAEQARDLTPLVCDALYGVSPLPPEQWPPFLSRGGRLDPVAVRSQFGFGIGYCDLHQSLFILAIPELYWIRHRDLPRTHCKIEALLPPDSYPLHRGPPNTWSVSRVRQPDQALDLALLLMKMGFAWSSALQTYCDELDPACPIGPLLAPISEARALDQAASTALRADFPTRRL